MGDLKARDIIPSWPRGRSTSRHKRVGRPDLSPIPWSDRFVFEKKSLEQRAHIIDYLVYAAEELRKADMMDGWYELKRQEARGPFYPSQSENYSGYDFLVSPGIFEYIYRMREFDEMLTGGRYLFGLDLATEDKS